MLEEFFKYPGVLARMRCGPLASEIDAVAEDLKRTGYTRLTARRYLSLVASFSRFAARSGCAGPERIDGALVGRFLTEFPRSASTRTVARTALGHVLRRLEQQYPAGSRKTVDDSDSRLLAEFDAHLRDVRGLRRRSRDGVLLLAGRMIAWYRNCRPGRSLRALRGEDVLDFVREITTEYAASSTRSKAVSHVRALLRYLRWTGTLHEDLARLVPRTPCWRLAKVPTHLAWSDVQRVIDAIGTADPVGKRDRALLLLLATTGLRSQEVRRLELRDVDWRTAELRVRRTKSRRQRVVPLVEETASALADYVLHGRPQSTDATVFLRHRPPVGPLRCSSTLAAIVRRRLARCGIRPLRAGAHLFRHSLATRMIQQERPVKAVADLLGHRSIDTTAVYVKVAIPQLRDVALPFPGGRA